MAWVEPKTDWASTDYFNVDDYARIVGNLKHLKTLLETMYAPIAAINLADTKGYNSFLYASEMNTIESLIEEINVYGFDIGNSQTFVQNGHTPDFNEWNRIESATLKIKQTLQAQRDRIPVLEFTLGQYGDIQV